MGRPTTYLLLAAGMALFGSATPVSKLVGDAFPSMLASGLRMAVAFLVLAPWLVRDHSSHALRRLERADRVRLLAIALVGTFGFTLFLFYGLRLAPGSVAAIVMATTPAVTALGAVLFLGNRLDAPTGAAVGLAVVGVGLVNVGGGGGVALTPDVLLGSLLVLGAVGAEAAYSLLGKRLGADLSPLAIAVAAAGLAGLLFLPLAAWQAWSFDWAGPTWEDWTALVWWGAGTMGLGSVVWFAGMRRASGTTASGFMAVMPVSALVLSYLLLDEAFAWQHAAGMGVVLAAIAALTARDARSSGE